MMMDNIVESLPISRQILLYSATFPLSVKEFMVSFILRVVALINVLV